jgi:beta-glucosidase
MVSSTSLTTLLILSLSSLSSTSAQDQSTPTSTSAGSAPESSSTGSPSVNTTYTPVISNHTNPLWNPNSNSTDPYAVGNNNSYSPPFPYTLTRGSGPTWESAIQKAKDFIQFHNLTIEEKVNLTTGLGWEGKGYSGRACVGNIPPIERIGWKGLCLEDSPAGVRFTDGVSVFPAGINVASTFDRGLMYSRGYAMGKEFVGKGVNVALGPGEFRPSGLGPPLALADFWTSTHLLTFHSGPQG